MNILGEIEMPVKRWWRLLHKTGLISWYRDGADVQRLLPKLSTYLGHVHISGTQRYLTLTPELLREASLRFENYAMEPSHD
jgi:hypothetical protein